MQGVNVSKVEKALKEKKVHKFYGIFAETTFLIELGNQISKSIMIWCMHAGATRGLYLHRYQPSKGTKWRLRLFGMICLWPHVLWIPFFGRSMPCICFHPFAALPPRQIQSDTNTEFALKWLPLFALDQPTAREVKAVVFLIDIWI